MRISIFGLGYVGAVSLACLARDGHQVVGVDIDPVKLDLLSSGRSPIVEEGIQQLTAEVVRSGRVRVTSDVAAAIRDTDVSFVCVGTPSNANGSQNLDAMLRLAQQLGEALALKKAWHVIVVRSTVQPGTVEETVRPIIEEHSGLRAGEHFSLCFQPEFLREGSSIRDYDNPPFTVVGSDDQRALAQLRDLFGHLPADFVATSIRTAEMLKYACNAFHAVKVTFANEIGRLAQSLSVDSHEVMRLLCMDSRLNISPAYLRPGFAFGGSCLPKDLKALLHIGKTRDVVTPALANLLASNRVHIDHAVDAVLEHGRPRVGMLGLSFKSGTDDLRESPLVTVAEKLIGKGVPLLIFDPEVNLSRLMGANKRYIEGVIPHIGTLMCATLEEIVQDSDVIIVGLANADLTAQLTRLLRPEQLVLDLVRVPDREKLPGRYRGVCW
jgi:GDP-mannose 6-dehydrogenase